MCCRPRGVPFPSGLPASFSSQPLISFIPASSLGVYSYVSQYTHSHAYSGFMLNISCSRWSEIPNPRCFCSAYLCFSPESRADQTTSQLILFAAELGKSYRLSWYNRCSMHASIHIVGFFCGEYSSVLVEFPMMLSSRVVQLQPPRRMFLNFICVLTVDTHLP